MVAYNMSEWRHFVRICRFSPKSDIFVLVVTFVLTVAFDLVVAIAVGIVLAAILFIKRMSDVTSVRAWKKDVTNDTEGREKVIPEGCVVYEISGPMFFADADKFLDFALEDGTRAMIIRMSQVPSIDASAMKNMEILLGACRTKGVTLILSHVNEQPMKVIRKAGFHEKLGAEYFARNIDVALAMAEEICKA